MRQSLQVGGMNNARLPAAQLLGHRSQRPFASLPMLQGAHELEMKDAATRSAPEMTVAAIVAAPEEAKPWPSAVRTDWFELSQYKLISSFGGWKIELG